VRIRPPTWLFRDAFASCEAVRAMLGAVSVLLRCSDGDVARGAGAVLVLVLAVALEPAALTSLRDARVIRKRVTRWRSSRSSAGRSSCGNRTCSVSRRFLED
jgi:hypothetical protein